MHRPFFSLMLTIKADFSGLQRTLRDLERQMPFVIASTLTATVKQAQKALESEIDRVFDRPVTFTKRAIGITPARKTALTASVFVKDKQAKYLRAQIEGGDRKRRPFEAKFAGDLSARVPSSVPGRGAKLNSSGNISKAQILTLARQAKAKGKSVGGAVYLEPRDGKAGGLFRREGRKLEPLLIFGQKSARYTKRFYFYRVGARAIQTELGKQFKLAINRAIATARKS